MQKSKLTKKVRDSIMNESRLLESDMFNHDNIQGMKDFIALVYSEDSEQQGLISWIDSIQQQKQ